MLGCPNLVQNSFVKSHFISVNCLLHDKGFSFARIYRANAYSVRRHLWRDLSSFPSPWCILGDFNVVLSADDCKGGATPYKVSCNEFLNWINNNNLTSMPFSSPCYTWTNGGECYRELVESLIELYVMKSV